jgi:hypothetical protein
MKASAKAGSLNRPLSLKTAYFLALSLSELLSPATSVVTAGGSSIRVHTISVGCGKLSVSASEQAWSGDRL